MDPSRKSMAQAREDLGAKASDERFAGEVEEMVDEQDLAKIDDDVEAEATLIEWAAEQHTHRPKSVGWYIGAGVVSLALIVVFSLLGNYLAVGIVLLGGGLLIFLGRRPSPAMRYRFMVHGIAINNWLYHYRDLDAFNIIYEPDDVKVLLIRGKKTLTPLLTLELGEVDPNQVGEILSEFIDQDLEIEEPFPDVLARRLGF